MFGRSWQPGEATIVAQRLLAKSFDGESGQSFSRNEYVLDVRPGNGSPPFRSTAKDPFNAITWRQPAVGDVVRVEFRDKDHEVKFDRTDPNLHQDTPWKMNKKAVEAAHSPEAQHDWHALATAAPAPPVPPAWPTERPSQAPPPALVEASSAMSSDFTDTMAAIKQAKAAGNHGEVDRLKAEFKARADERAQLSRQAAARLREHADSAALPAPPSADPIERLRKLADLRDRGVLTDIEFAAEKAKILSGGA